MPRLPRPRVTYANVVSTLCLVFALGGGAWAATGGFAGAGGKIHGCISSKGQLAVLKAGKTKCKRGLTAISWNQTGPAGTKGQKGDTGPPGPATGPAGGDLTGNYPNPAIAPNAVTGAKVDEATLGQVPSAASADNATAAGSATTAGTASDASALGGLAPDQYFRTSNVQRVEGALIQKLDGQTTANLVSVGGMTLVMECSSDSGQAKQKMRIGIASTGANARVRWGFVTGNTPLAGDIAVAAPPSSSVMFERDVASSVGDEKGAGNIIYRDDAQTISIPFWYDVGYFQSNCTVSGTATRAAP